MSNSAAHGSAFRYTPDALVKIRAWVRGGRDPSWMARQLDCSMATLIMVCADHDIPLVPKPVIGDAQPPLRVPDVPVEPRLDPVRRKLRRDVVVHAVHLDRHASDALAREAARRGTNATTLAAVVLEIIASDTLFAAVLDN